VLLVCVQPGPSFQPWVMPTISGISSPEGATLPRSGV